MEDDEAGKQPEGRTLDSSQELSSLRMPPQGSPLPPHALKTKQHRGRQHSVVEAEFPTRPQAHSARAAGNQQT